MSALCRGLLFTTMPDILRWMFDELDCLGRQLHNLGETLREVS